MRYKALILASIFCLLPLNTWAETIKEKTAVIFGKTSQNKESISLKYEITPNGQAINAVALDLDYPADKLTLTSVNRSSSFCLFFIEEEINNTKGHLLFSCGLPNPGISTTSEIIKINFKKKKAGSINFHLSEETMALANDGLGTDILKEAVDTKLIIK